jgi:glycosyltransferase involved in cell wall biosynthesis
MDMSLANTAQFVSRDTTDIAVVILTFNEEKHIERAIRSVLPIARQIFVIDSFSTDNTCAIAHALGAVVLQHPFTSHAAQFQWGLDNAPITAEWILRLDADEIIEADLVDEIQGRLDSLPADVTGINLKRKQVFMDRWIRHGGRYPLVLLRIWRRGKGRVESRWMDEHVFVVEGRTVTFNGGFADHNLNDLTFFTEKHNHYATNEAVDVLNAKYHLFFVESRLPAEFTSSQAYMRRWFKLHIYNRIPSCLGATLYFVFRYFIQGGFRDGKEGLVYHFLQGFWYRFLVGAKLKEFDDVLARLDDRDSRLAALTRLTGRSLS